MKLTNKELAAVGLISAALLIIAYKISTISNYVIMKVWDTISENRIKTLHPLLQEKARNAINELDTQHNIKVRVTAAKRSFKEQTDLYNKGRTTGGKIVTNANAGQSYHNYGLALDVVEVQPLYGFNAGYDTSRWNTIADVFKKYGFAWGGDFKSFKDRPHFQMTFGLSTGQLYAMHTKQQYTETGHLQLT